MKILVSRSVDLNLLRSAGRLRMVQGELVSCSMDVYLALEHCGAGDLHQLTGQLSPGEIRDVMWQLTCGALYMHDVGVWHRDLKSANILLLVRDGRTIVKIADLGACHSSSAAGYSCRPAWRSCRPCVALLPPSLSVHLCRL